MNASITKTNRIEWLDACKGFAIVLVVIGHVLSGYIGKGLFAEHLPEMHYTYELIYSFHMPLFFILSGYVFQIAYSANAIQRKVRFKLQIMNNIYIYIMELCTMGGKYVVFFTCKY